MENADNIMVLFAMIDHSMHFLPPPEIYGPLREINKLYYLQHSRLAETTVRQIAVAIFSLNPGQHMNFGISIPLAFKRAVLAFLLLTLFLAEILRVYFVMPYPGSQVSETVDIAYWLSTHIFWIRVIALTLTGYALIQVFRRGTNRDKILLSATLLAYIPLYFLFNFRFAADKIFYPPSTKAFTRAAQSIDQSRLVIGIEINGEAKAYPIQYIGYHHQVVDTVGNEPVIITYCTVCRAGRVYSTRINGQAASFRLVGMNHFNAVFEDEATHSWWQQASGKAITGPLKGSSLKEIPSSQLTVSAWTRRYPNSLLMEGDSHYDERYFKLEDYDRGKMQGKLVRRDFRSWQPKSWIVGVKNESASVAYDWNDLVKKRMIQDSLESMPILLAMEADTMSFHVYDRRINNSVLQFQMQPSGNQFTDTNTASVWTMEGLCIEGPLKGQHLNTVQSYNEFWHSWEKFQVKAKKFGAP